MSVESRPVVARSPIAIVGLGQLGAVFADGALRSGRLVVPLRRGDPLQTAAPFGPELVLVAVGERDLGSVLEALPAEFHDRTALLQNELLPVAWERHGLASPTVAVIWFEKKPEKPVKVLLPSVLHGPRAAILREALTALHIPVRDVDPELGLLGELVLKNLYILVLNTAGLRTRGTVGDLWSNHRELTLATAHDVLELQAALALRPLPPTDRLLTRLVEAFAADPDHQCTGRTAAARLERAVALAREHGLAVPTLTALHDEHRGGQS
jgi:hypothetical protein